MTGDRRKKGLNNMLIPFSMEMLIHLLMLRNMMIHFALKTMQGTGLHDSIPRRTQQKKKGLKRKKTTWPVIEDDDTDASSIHSNEKEDVPEFIDEDYVDSISATKIIELNATIKKCYSCGLYYSHEKMVPPYNLIFSRKTKRMCPDGKGGQI